MTKYNSLSEYMHDIFFKPKTYEEAMKEFNAEIEKIKKYIRTLLTENINKYYSRTDWKTS